MLLTPATVLIAEDSPTQRALFGDVLRDDGFDVHEAPDGRIALDLCRILCPDLLVLDLELPRLGGEEVLARVRADHKIGRTPILALTADAREATIAAVLERGASDFLAKPARPLELVARAHRALRERAVLPDLGQRNDGRLDTTRIDTLTGLPNHDASAEALAAAAAQAGEHHRPMAVALLDVDDLGAIGDADGPLAGDHVLCALAGRLRDRARHSDTVGRWSAEGFIVAMPDADPRLAAAAAEALRRACAAEAIRLEGDRASHVTVSVGWACSSDVTAEELVERAAAALLQARSGGGNRVAAAAEAMLPAV